MLEESETRNRKFSKMLEEAIRQANREVIDPMLPPVTVDTVLPVAVMVAKMRGRYIAEAFKLVSNKKDGFPEAEQIAKLREYREAYEEVLTVSQALEHAIGRGYLELGDSPS